MRGEAAGGERTAGTADLLEVSGPPGVVLTIVILDHGCTLHNTLINVGLRDEEGAV